MELVVKIRSTSETSLLVDLSLSAYKIGHTAPIAPKKGKAVSHDTAHLR